MTNEELQQHIKAIEGALNAGEVQQIDDDDYLTLGPDDFITLNIPDLAYRIKPAQREMVLADAGTTSSGRRMYLDVTDDISNDWACVDPIRVKVIDQ